MLRDYYGRSGWDAPSRETWQAQAFGRVPLAIARGCGSKAGEGPARAAWQAPAREAERDAPAEAGTDGLRLRWGLLPATGANQELFIYTVL